MTDPIPLAPPNNALNQPESLAGHGRASAAWILSGGEKNRLSAAWRRRCMLEANPLSGLCRLWEYPLSGRTRPLEHSETLHTLSEVATAFAGFSGIIIALGSRRFGNLDKEERLLFSNLIACSLGVVLFGLVPDLLNLLFESHLVAWRISALLFAVFHVSLLARTIRARATGQVPADRYQMSRLFASAMSIGAISTCALQVATVAGFFPSLLIFAYVLAMVYILWAAAVTFYLLLLSESKTDPEA
jgi:hypothetical protein